MLQKNLHIKEWGVGNSKTAVLIHGIASSSITWNKVAERLAELGYHVYAPDLAGHGKSSRFGSYSVKTWGEDSLSLLPRNPDLAIGHSLGGLVLANIHHILKPQKTVFVDPAFYLPIKPISKLVHGVLIIDSVFKRIFSTNETLIRKHNPLWSDEAISDEALTVSQWDYRTIHGIMPTKKIMNTFFQNPGESLILIAHKSILVPKIFVNKIIRQNIQVKRMTGSGHTIHRDKFTDFMREIITFT